MVTILTAPRYRLEEIVRTYGYTEAEVKEFSIWDLQECIWCHDRPEEAGDV